ncbi:MAG: PQQ-like beta-propeller repeat protein [Sedimentisphaerales bacterium]|nr:PQQ-like beta-propeller repeat protein [Sedimentisphaerales bacterium]
MKNIFNIIIVAIISGVCILYLLVMPQKPDLPVRVPGTDGRGAVSAGGKTTELDFQFNALQDIAALSNSMHSENWPWFRGTNYDGIWQNNAYKIITDLSAPLECLWKVELGEGYAGATVYDGIVYVLDYDAVRQRDVLRAINLTDGSDIWQLSYNIKIKRDHGMSRAIPAVNDKYIVTIGPRCQVVCADRVTGEKLWHLDLVQDYGTKVPLWHASQCPLLDGNTAIIAPAGSTLIMAVDCATGNILWETSNPDKWQMTHSSVMPVYVDGVKMYAYCGDGGIAGFDPSDGKKLWVNYDWKMRTNVPSPVDLGNNTLFLSAGYNKGCALLEIYRTLNVSGNDGREVSQSGTVDLASSEHTYETKMVYTRPASFFGAVQHTPIYHKGYLYGIRQDKTLVCLDPAGKIMWESPKDDKYGDSPYIIANDLIVALDDHGTLSLVKAIPDSYELIARQQVLFGRESWGLMAIVDGLLILRDFTEMRCIRIAIPQ